MVLEELDRHRTALDVLLGDGAWLAGGRLSLADLAVASQLHAVAGAVEGRAALDAHPVTVAWLDRVNAAAPPA